jgi:DNA-directed RNA polymerase II subunit RPB3
MILPSVFNVVLNSRQGLGELQTKLANLILGLKTQPELDQLVNDPQDSRAHAPAAWGQPGGDGGGWDASGGGGGGGGGGWGSTSPSRAGAGAGGSSAGWGTSPSHPGGGGWGNASPTRGGAASTAWGVSPNANGADTAGWGGPASTGWQSPTQKTNSGWNV